jgi:proline dehydrogenase
MKINFEDTQIAFERKTNRELHKMRWLFNMMSNNWLVNLGSKASLLGLRMGLPIKGLIKSTIFEQFCGGQSLEDSRTSIEGIAAYGVGTVLDYGAEAKDSDEEFDKALAEFMKTVEFASRNPATDIISTKVTSMARFDILEKIGMGVQLTNEDQISWEKTVARLDLLCRTAKEKRIALFVDAEESWIQDAIDQLTDEMMERYNTDSLVVYNTFQMYRHDRLEFLKASLERAKSRGYLLGAKLVRGAYMEKERERAKEMGYLSPIQPDKASTDRDYDLAVKFCVENYDFIASCVASHNQKSTEYQIQLMEEKGLPKDHPHLTFCQLYGMSDNLTFNLAKAGYKVSKYVPFGPIKDVIPYLIRRAQENSSVGGEVGRELLLINKEIARRKRKR